MDSSAQVTAVLHAQAGMLLFIGLVMLFAHYTSRRLKANNGAVWYGISTLSGSLGLYLASEYDRLPLFCSVVLGNLFFLGHVTLLTYAVALVTQQTTRMVRWVVAASLALVGGLAWLTWFDPSRTGRVLLVSTVLPFLLVPSILLLLRTPDKVIRPATSLLAAMLLVFDLGLLARAIQVLRDHRILTAASWSGTIFIAGEALCFFWVDMLRLSAQLESQAMTDPLTALLNRRAMETFARRELARCHRQGQAIAALMIDMDDFKQINDRYGHSVGDEALLKIGDVIRQSVRAVDLAARIGGDEFLVLLPDASEVAVRTVTSRLRSAIDQVRVPTRTGEAIGLSATIGQTRSLRGDTTLHDLMQHSDQNLYEQKQSVRSLRKVELLSADLLHPAHTASLQSSTQPSGPVA